MKLLPHLEFSILHFSILNLHFPTTQYPLQELPRVTPLNLGHCLGCPLGHDTATRVATLGAQVDDPVGGLDDVEVVLDDDDGVARVDQALEDRQQHADVLEMEAGGRFIQDVEGLAGIPFGQFAGQLDTLRFASRQRDSRLAQFDVTQSHVYQGL